MATNRHSSRPHGEDRIIVGRDREQARLGDLLSGTLNGVGNLALISGEAGIGKTTLVRDLVQQARERGALVLSGGCYDLTTTPPYGPWIEITRRYPTSDDTLPSLPDQLRQGSGMTGVSSQAELFELAYDFFVEVSARRPLLLVLEDLHWSDQASLDLLRYLSRHLDDVAILILVTHRDEILREHELYQLLPLIIRESSAQRIHLGRLERDAVREIVEVGYTLDPEDSARLVAHLTERGEGNPFFTTELLRSLESDGVLQRTPDGWSLADVSPVQVPPLVLQVIERRLTHLGVETRIALEIAAIIGQEIPLDLWRGLLAVVDVAFDQIIAEAVQTHVIEEADGRSGLRFRHALLQEALYESMVLSRRRALHRQVGEVLAAMPDLNPDAVAHHFQEAGDSRAAPWLIQAGERAMRLYAWKTCIERWQAALEVLEASGADLTQRGWLHYRIGRLRRYADPRQGIRDLEMAERLATAGGNRVLAAFALADRGLIYCFAGDIRQGLAEMLAGDRALEMLESDRVPDDDTHLAWIAEALPAVEMPENGDRNRWAWGINIRRGALVTRLAMAGRYAEALALGEPYAERVGTLSERNDILLAAVQDVQLGLGATYAAFGRPREAREAFARARAAYRQIDHYHMIGASALNELYQIVIPYQTTRLDERQRLADIAQPSFQRARGATELDIPHYHPLYLPLLLLEGRWDTAHEIEVACLGNRMSDVRWAAMVARGQLARLQGNPVLAWQQVYALLPEGPNTEPGNCDILPAMSLQRTAIELALDKCDLETAAAWIEAYHRWIEWSGRVLGRAELELLWSRYHWLTGDLDRAHRHAAKALEHASDPRQPLALLAAHRLLGGIETQQGRYVDAEANLRQSLTLANACAAPYEQALTKLALAELSLAAGKREAVGPMLDQARELCISLDARPALSRIDDLASQLAAHESPPATLPAGLTAREGEVLRLIAQGHSNREIAETLFLSPRTVERHIANLYLKIDVHTKVEATAYARRQHLA